MPDFFLLFLSFGEAGILLLGERPEKDGQQK
jgi:hypothetical protein